MRAAGPDPTGCQAPRSIVVDVKYPISEVDWP